MAAYRDAPLAPGFQDIRASILDDLSTFYRLPPEECVQRCLNWGEWSVQEWQPQQRKTREDLAEFYHTTPSWAFDLLWYAYFQAEGFHYPVSVTLARTVPRPTVPGGLRHLDSVRELARPPNCCVASVMRAPWRISRRHC